MLNIMLHYPFEYFSYSQSGSTEKRSLRHLEIMSSNFGPCHSQPWPGVQVSYALWVGGMALLSLPCQSERYKLVGTKWRSKVHVHDLCHGSQHSELDGCILE